MTDIRIKNLKDWAPILEGEAKSYNGPGTVKFDVISEQSLRIFTGGGQLVAFLTGGQHSFHIGINDQTTFHFDTGGALWFRSLEVHQTVEPAFDEVLTSLEPGRQTSPEILAMQRAMRENDMRRNAQLEAMQQRIAALLAEKGNDEG